MRNFVARQERMAGGMLGRMRRGGATPGGAMRSRDLLCPAVEARDRVARRRGRKAVWG